MLPITIVQKIMEECFQNPDGAAGIISVPMGARQDWFEKLVPRLKAIARVDSRAWALEREKNDDNFILGLYIRGVRPGRNPNDYFKLHFHIRDGREGLWILDAKKRQAKTKIEPLAVGSLEQLFLFIDRIKERQDRDHLQEIRKQKIASLRQTGLTARLKELGQIHDFSFAMSQTTRDIKLSIRIKNRKRGFHFAFPKGKLAAVIENIPELIQTFERLQALGVNFRTEPKQWKRESVDWIVPEVTDKSQGSAKVA